MRDKVELAVNVEKNHAVKSAVGRNDVGLQAERTELVFDVLRLVVFAGQIAAGQSRKVVRLGRGGAFRMGDARSGLRSRQCRKARVLTMGIFDVEANGGKVHMDGSVQVIFEKYLHGENAGLVRISFAKCFLAAICVGVGVGGDGESLMRVFGEIVRWRGHLRVERGAGDEHKSSKEQGSYFHAGDRCKRRAKRCELGMAVTL